MGRYLPILIFAGVRRQTLASPQRSFSPPPSLPPSSSSLSPPSLSLSQVQSIWWLVGCCSPRWFVSTGGFLNLLCTHPLCFAPCLVSLLHFFDRQQTGKIAQMMSVEDEAWHLKMLLFIFFSTYFAAKNCHIDLVDHMWEEHVPLLCQVQPFPGVSAAWVFWQGAKVLKKKKKLSGYFANGTLQGKRLYSHQGHHS